MTTAVLIVGAGPVGLTMAAELARYRVPLRIIDKAASPSDKSKALVVWSRTLELLERAGCAAPFVAAGHRVRAANLIAGTKLVARIELDGIDSPYPFALMLPQPETERLLAAQLESYGVRIERELQLTGFVQRAEQVDCTVRDASGRERTIEAQWLIGCDGAHSTVRHKLGMPFIGDTLATDFILADVHVEGLRIPERELAVFWHPDGVVAFFPIKRGRYRVIADVGPADGGPRRPPTMVEVQAIVDARGPGWITLSDPVWLAPFSVNERRVEQYRAGRVFLAGDAAHVHSPAGGQGMNTGMQDAFNLAWKLALVVRGEAPPGPLLDSYSQERSAIGEQVMHDTARLTKLVTLKNAFAQDLRNLIAHRLFGLRVVQHRFADRLSEVSVAYPDSPLSAGSSQHLTGPAPGHRVMPAGGDAPFGAGDTPRFALCAAPDEAAKSLLDRHPALVEGSLRPSVDESGIWLVRPDGYVAMVAKAGHSDEVGAYLRQVSAPWAR